MRDVQKQLIRNWKIASVVVLAGVLIGISLLFQSEDFDATSWRAETTAARSAVAENLALSIESLGQQKSISAAAELAFAEAIDQNASRLQDLISLGEAELHPPSSKSLTKDEITLMEIKFIYRSLRVLERIHLSRAILADADLKTSPALWELSPKSVSSGQNVTLAEGPRAPDGLFQFWNGHRPWMSGELEALESMNNELLRAANQNQDSLASSKRIVASETSSETSERVSSRASGKISATGFEDLIVALENDLARISQAAMDLELRRVDTWIEWAVRQPGSRLPAVQQDATFQVKRLDMLATTHPELPIAEDPRIHSLQRDLRRVAFAATQTRWQ